jgi:hypothetical protein
MDNFDFTLDLTEADAPRERGEFTMLPDGTYEIECIECTPKTTKSGGTMWAATFVVLDPGPGYNRRLWHNFNVVNASAKAQQIARAELKKLLLKKEVDLSKATPQDLIGIKVEAKVLTKEDPNYGPKNIIQSFVFDAPTSDAIPF